MQNLLGVRPKVLSSVKRRLSFAVCCGILLLFEANARATQYSSLSIPQNTSVQIGSPSENLILYMQPDGNLVLYQYGTALWSSGTFGQNCGSNQCYAVFQGDGNFVVYNGSTPLWNSQTGGNSGAHLILTDQLPHIEIVSGNQSILWANSYVFSAGNLVIPQGASVNLGSAASLLMQPDGNLVMYESQAVWNSGTGGQNCGANQCSAVFQPDGNFVVYNGSTPLWNSGTAGNSGAQLIISTQTPYIQVVGSLSPTYATKEYIRLNGQVIAIENN